MAEPESDRIGVPSVHDKRRVPPGVLPKNIQTWVLGALATVMVCVIAFSGKRAPKAAPSTANATSVVLEADDARIRDYQKRIEEQVRKLQLEQAQLARTREALTDGSGRATSGNVSNGNALPSSFSPTEASGYTTARLRADPTFAGDSGRVTRESQAFFASNVALSYRKDDSAARRDPAVNVTGETAKERDGSLQRSEGKKYRLFEGTFLETVLTNRLDGSFSGPVNCMVTTSVYSHDGRHLLVPQGARAVGETRKVETFGQERLAVVFHRLIMPDGFSVDLDQFQGLNQVGETALKDQINHHYLQVFGVSLAIGGIAGLDRFNTRSGTEVSAMDVYREGVANSLSQSSLRILDRYLNVLPTVTIREGHRVKVFLAGDLLLPDYDQHQIPSDI